MRKAIELRNVSYSYPDVRNALKDINMDVFYDESIGIIGANGAGKTTLLLHLNGILKGEGMIRVLGMEIDNNLRKIRSKVGLVFQNPDDQLFCPTIFDDIAFGLLNSGMNEEEVKKRVKDVLQKIELTGFENKMSHHLSVGEKKRVSLATVLAMDPEILVLDEPTANLDPHSRRHLIAILKGLNHIKIIASHDLEMIAELTKKVILFNNGKKVTEGKTKEILSDKELMESNLLEVPLSLNKLES